VGQDNGSSDCHQRNIQPSAFEEIQTLKSLIDEGQRIQYLPESDKAFHISGPSELAMPTSIAKEQWVKKALYAIHNIFPSSIINSDFGEFINIAKSHSTDEQAIFIDHQKDIDVTLTVLKTLLEFFEWLLVDDSKLKPYQDPNLTFGSLKTMVEYIQNILVPKLIKKEDGRTTKTALLHLYGRIFLLINSLVKLDQFICCQLLVASLRTLFELYIDLILIKYHIIDKDIEKFFSFFDVYKFQTAERLVKLDGELNRPLKESSMLKKYLECSQKIIKKRQELWGKSKPLHWTGLKLEDRARRANKLKIFRDVYYYGNIYVHSGYEGLGTTEKDAHLLCAYAYGFSSELFNESTEILCNEINIPENKDVLHEMKGLYSFYAHFQAWKSLVGTQGRV
jgi:hypothetical protein